MVKIVLELTNTDDVLKTLEAHVDWIKTHKDFGIKAAPSGHVSHSGAGGVRWETIAYEY